MGCNHKPGWHRTLTIVSGGQTGADRAALDFALRCGFEHDGWCPLGRRAEDGRLPDDYQLRETPTAKYDERTRWNVRDSDATLVFSIAAIPSGGTALTLAVARRLGKPFLHLAQQTWPSIDEAASQLLQFLEKHHVQRLNVAGPRASQAPQISRYVDAVLAAALAENRAQ